MSIAYVSGIIDADIEAVWSVLHDFHGIDRWVDRIRSAGAEDGTGPAAVGSVRRLTMEPDGRVVRERLVHYDAPGHRYSYEFGGDQPFPVRAYRGTVHLLPITQSGTTFAEWYGEFDCDAGAADRLTGVFTRIYAGFLDDLRKHLAGPEVKGNPLAPPDRAAIDDLLTRYCFAIDLRDWEGLREIFANDAVITYSGPRVSAGIDQIVEFFRSTTSAVAATQHLLHTSRVWATGPDTAEGLSHVTAHHVGQDAARPAPAAATYTVTGTYHDEFARTGDGWRITGRTLTLLTSAGDPAILREG